MPEQILKNLPIGYSSLVEIINGNCVYVDKTSFVKSLADKGKYYFLSRPRRFGKSLFLDTLKQAFLGNKELFTGLYLEHNWDWNVTYPVIHISFASGELKTGDALAIRINNILQKHANDYQLELLCTDIPSKFEELITKLHDKCKQRVVVLVDEYDKPILDNITELEISSQMRSGLRDLYSVIKDCDSHLKFVFLTGITKFNKVSVFSGLNNLDDITLDEGYADICGYTQAELEYTFDDYLVDVDKAELKLWYNGYNFLGSEAQKVYNPMGILLFFKKNKKFANYWFATATPTYLIKLLKQNNYPIPDIENKQIAETVLDSFDIENIDIETLLFQTGYLTITEVVPQPLGRQVKYRLNYPNFEVRQSLNSSILFAYFGSNSGMGKAQDELLLALVNNDFHGLQTILHAFFASIPHDWYRKNKLFNYEGFYASVIYSCFNSTAAIATPEDITNHGQIDLTVELEDKIVLFEFKIKENSTEMPLEQIKINAYYEKYLSHNKPIYMVGILFSKAKRNIVDLDWKKYNPL